MYKSTCLLSTLLAVCGMSISSLADGSTSTREVLLNNGSKLVLDVHIAPGFAMSRKIVVVCSPTAADDISRLKKVANNFFPRLEYSIVDAKDFKFSTQKQNYTFLYVGPPVDLNSFLPCLDLVPGFRKFAALRTKLHLAELKKLYAKMGRNVEDFADLSDLKNCLSSPPSAEVFGRLENWSVHLRSPPENICAETYFLFFGLENVCFHRDCRPEDESALLELLK